MVIRMRHTTSHTANRRSHHALKPPRLSRCLKCQSLHQRHVICMVCGTYRGRQVVDVLQNIGKKDKKQKQKKN